jgi:hypothetical protein
VLNLRAKNAPPERFLYALCLQVMRRLVTAGDPTFEAGRLNQKKRAPKRDPVFLVAGAGFVEEHTISKHV